MGANSKIAWCDHTFNPWIGCTKVASGCAYCYAEADFDKRRHKAKWGPNGTRVRTSEAYWKQPLKWNREAAKAMAEWQQSRDDCGVEYSGAVLDQPIRPRVFCASLCDVFEQWGGVIQGTSISTFNDVRRDLFALIDATPNLDWLLLTKRPENIRRFWPNVRVGMGGLHRNNVWLGCSASTQQDLEAAIPHLLACRDLAPVLFLSLEPLIGPVNLNEYFKRYYPSLASQGGTIIDWVIVGGESGSKARVCNVKWIRETVDQCRVCEVPCFVKQLGVRSVGEDWVYSVEESKGGDPIEWPEDLRVREFPQ